MGFFLREHPQDEASLAMRFEGGGDDGVLSGRQLEPFTHLPQIDEGLTAGHSHATQQDIRAEVDVSATFILSTEEETGQTETAGDSCCVVHTRVHDMSTG